MNGHACKSCRPVETLSGHLGLIPWDKRISWQTWNLGTSELRYWSLTGALWGPTLAAGVFGLGGLHRHVRSCHSVWGLLGCRRLSNLPVGWGRWHGDLPLEHGEINLLPPQLGQVSFGIQERVPVTPFEDWIHGSKVAHHLQRARLPHGRINQQAAVVLQL